MDTRLFDAELVEKVKKLHKNAGDTLSRRRQRSDEALRLVKVLSGATPADMDKIRESGLPIYFCIEAALAGLSASEILKLGRTNESLSNYLYRHRVLNAAAAGRTLREVIAELSAMEPSPRQKRRRMSRRKAKAQLNPRQLWRRRRSRGRGTKGGARK